MMTISQKCQYALRAVFELAKQQGESPLTSGQIAEQQDIPPRFLELILSELKQAGFLRSYRGKQGGYVLTVRPSELTAGQVIRLVDGPIEPVRCRAGTGFNCPLKGKWKRMCAFDGMWKEVGQRMAQVLDSTTFQILLDQQDQLPQPAKPISTAAMGDGAAASASA